MLIKSEFSEELATVIFFRLKSIKKYFEFEQLFVDKKTRQGIKNTHKIMVWEKLRISADILLCIHYSKFEYSFLLI